MMDWKMPALLSLLFLAAAAAPPDDCGAGADNGQALPIPLDLAGRPNASSGLSGQTFGGLPSSESGNGCRSPLTSSAQPTTLRSESGDVLHGLPMPDILRPMDEPKRAPEFR
jgi:hypothetical protein